jgi:hypothetical protein
MSDDILSGGRIDESTDGPNPSSVDDRSRNILQEQKAQQDQDAVGGTQFPPRVEPLPPIPAAPEVAPPLPVVPSFDFNVSGSVLEEVREITRQAMVDAFKNVTINGQSPSIEGSAISFNVQPPQPSASEAFMFQSGEVVQAGPPTAIPPPPPQPREGVQTVVVSPPSRPREEPEAISEQRERESNEREARDQEIRVSLGLAPTPVLDQQSEPSTPKGKSISEQNEEENAARVQRDTEVRASVGLSGEDPMDEESDSAKAYKEAEARSDERRENDPNFDRESGIRQRGETPTEFKERQEQLKQEKIERAEREEKMSRVREGDLTEMPSGMIPVRFTRADGQRKILALVATELVGTVEGATEGERTLTLPPENSFFEGGGGVSSHPFNVITRTIGGNLYWGILERSYAWTFMNPTHQGNINGLLTTGEEGDPNWIQISQNPDYIYLEYDQDNAETKILTVGSGGNFNPTLNNVESSGNWLEIELDEAIADFKFARKIIARADGTNIVQFVRNHQLLQDICYNGNPARYWFDFSKGNTP